MSSRLELPMGAGLQGRLWAQFQPGCASPLLRRIDAPLELRGPHADADGCPSFLIRNVTAGMFPRDRYDVRLHTAPGAAATIGSPSATQVHTGHGPATRSYLRLEADPGSRLTFVPRPTVLHAGAKLDQSVELISPPGSALFYADILVLGRLAMGERLAFARLESHLRLRSADALVYEERHALDPLADGRPLDAALRGAGAIVTIVLTGLVELQETRARIAAQLSALTGCYAGTDELPAGTALLVRGLAPDAQSAVKLVDLVRHLSSTAAVNAGTRPQRS